MTTRKRLIIGAVGAYVLSGLGWYTCGFRGCPDPETLLAYEAGAAPAVGEVLGWGRSEAFLRGVPREPAP